MTALFFVPIELPDQALSTPPPTPDRSQASNDPLFPLLFEFRVLPDRVLPVELASSRIPLRLFSRARLPVTVLLSVFTKLNPFNPFPPVFVVFPAWLLAIVRPEEFSNR